MSEERQSFPIQAKILVLIIVLAGLYFVRGCASMWSAASSAAAEKNEADTKLLFSASDEDLKKTTSIIEQGKSVGWILKIKVDAKKHLAELHVMPALMEQDIDTKSKVYRAAYLNAFGLPVNTESFGGLMYVMHGVTGKQLQTLDMRQRGTAFR